MPFDEAVQRLLDGFIASLRPVVPLRTLWVHGSLALGDFQPGRSDLDLIAVLDGPIADVPALEAVHRSLEAEHPLAAGLHCGYLQVDELADVSLRHPCWAHREYFDRPVGAVTRRELALGDLSLYGPAPSSLLPAISDTELAAFIRAELAEFWYPAAAKWTRWRTDSWVDLGLLTVARASVTLGAGRLITKREALQLLPSLGAPARLVQDIRERRYGASGSSVRAGSGFRVASGSGESGAFGGDPVWRLRRGLLARRLVRFTIPDLLA